MIRVPLNEACWLGISASAGELDGTSNHVALQGAVDDKGAVEFIYMILKYR